MPLLETAKQFLIPVFRKRNWEALGRYLGLSPKNKFAQISDINSLSDFINTRSSHVAQISLYGYLKTRAGTRFPTLFENPDILKSINMAKWHIWIACVSDLSIFIGHLGRLAGQTPLEISVVMTTTFNRIIDNIGYPEEAGDDFQSSLDKAGQRIKNHSFSDSPSDDDIFSQSPEALYYWAPIADELKERDETIVRNSVRFRWIEVRRSCRELIDIDTLVAIEKPS